jgi:hypothetical protein
LTYRVKIRVHADADGKFPAELVWTRLYVDENHAQWHGLRSKQGGAPVEWTFIRFRKNQYERVAVVFALPESTTQHAPADEQNVGGTLKVVFCRAHDTGETEEVIALSTVPASVAATVEGAKFWKQPSIVTETGKRLGSKVAGRCTKWNLGKELATLTLPYHSADTIAFLQQFHGAQRQRGLLAQAARDARQGGPTELMDLSDETPPMQRLRQSCCRTRTMPRGISRRQDRPGAMWKL